MRCPNRSTLARAAAGALLCLVPLGVARGARAQLWTESGDAGDGIATAQHTSGSGPLTGIQGTFASANDVDLYCIQITSPAAFSAYLSCAAMVDPNLWLFDASGTGLTTQDDCRGGQTLITGAHVPGPGTYYLAVACEGMQAVSPGGPIWLTSVFSPTERQPDGVGAPGPLVGWTGTGTQTGPGYQVVLTGATFCDAATPTLHGSWGGLKSIYR